MYVKKGCIKLGICQPTKKSKKRLYKIRTLPILQKNQQKATKMGISQPTKKIQKKLIREVATLQKN